MKPLRIAMMCDIVPGQAGGSYISTVRFAELLRAKGHHVILVGAKDARQPRVGTYRGIPVYQFFALPTPGSDRFYFQSFPRRAQLRKLFREERIDIVHIMFPSYSCWIAKRVARELGLPLVAHIHTQPENVVIFFPFFLRTEWVRRLVLRYLIWFVRDAKRILCPSELGRSIYHSMDPSLPITVLSNGVNLAEFHQVATDVFMQKHGFSSEHHNILFIGRLADDKDPETLVRAVPEMLVKDPRARVWIVSTGPLMDKLRTLIRSLKIEGKVTLLGRISNEDRLAAYNACDLFVLPSKVELEGMVVLEAMACGKPILIADAPMSASKYFVNGNGLLFAPGDSHDLAEKAISILGDRESREKMGRASAASVRAYDINQSASRLEEIYRSVV